MKKQYEKEGNYVVLVDSGDCNSVFKDCKLLKDCVMSNSDTVLVYITHYLGGVIGDEYAAPYGQERITEAD